MSTTMEQSAERYDIPADAFTLHGTEAAWLLREHVRGVEPVAPLSWLAPDDVATLPPTVETREVCLKCGEPWEQWGCPTRRAVLLVGIYRREWKRQERIARRAMGWLAEVGSVADWRDSSEHGALEFKMLVAKDALAQFRGDFLHAVLQRASDAFKAVLGSDRRET